jgi:Icc-related predicted phosphoesterase
VIKVKILCVSDTVVSQMENAANLRRRYADVELIISCGDLSAAYLEFITSVLGVPLFYVRGNHDQMYADTPPGGTDLHRQVVRYGGLTFAGLEGCIRYNQSTIQYSEAEMAGMVLRYAPRMLYARWRRGGSGVDVLVTHSPAKDIHDADDRPHRGFRSLRWFIDWYRPRYMVHGHVHTYDRRVTTETTRGGTEIININPYTVLDISVNSERA